jgi:molybdopterin-guanine dinucleotide biosynthesis protein A
MKILSSTPPLFGLVLAGGKSKRMGRDKGLLSPNGKPQRDHLFDLLQPLCEQTFYSIREDQTQELPEGRAFIVDLYEGLGPKGAIMSAFKSHPSNAWLIVATDLYLLNKELLQLLIEKRNPRKNATVIVNKDTGYYEPLITIWEPLSMGFLQRDLDKGITCPRKTLMNIDVQLIENAPTLPLTNANHPENMNDIYHQLNRRSPGE